MRTAISTLLITFLSASVLFASPAYAASSAQSIVLNNIRAIRISDTSISFSFITDTQAIGVVQFVDVDGSTVTLSDSQSQKDHLFTLEPLDPTRGYSFTLTASDDEGSSNRYVILLAPEGIGSPGQSIVPPIDILGPDGTKISSTPITSTTPVETDSPPAWPFVAVAIGAAGAWVAYRMLRARASSGIEIGTP